VELEAEAVEIPGKLWVHELVGALVFGTDGTPLGTVRAVEANPASDLLVLETGGLIPLRFVTESDAAAGTLVVDIPEGLLDP
jgi:ribosomal 30S subunit maturation factor RimM